MASSTPESTARAICHARGLTYVGAVGAGAFKDTFHVRDAAGESLALKVFRSIGSPERAAREIDAMRRCNHANIGRLTDINQYQATLYTLEEYLPGGTLTSRVTGGPLTPAECFTLGIPLIDAVSHVAGLGLVHRDLKPDNILFRADGLTPVIVDFGLVRDLAAGSLTVTYAMQGPGTPFFAPAEQLLNAKAMIDWRADQFSLGVLLAFSTFGYHPYAEANDTPVEIISRVAQRVPTPARFRSAAVAAGLPALITMTEAWPVQRYRTPDALVQAWATRPHGQPTAQAAPSRAP